MVNIVVLFLSNFLSHLFSYYFIFSVIFVGDNSQPYIT